MEIYVIYRGIFSFNYYQVATPRSYYFVLILLVNCTTPLPLGYLFDSIFTAYFYLILVRYTLVDSIHVMPNTMGAAYAMWS